MMFDALCIGIGDLCVNAQDDEEFSDDAVALACGRGQQPTLVGQKDRAVGLAGNETVALQAPDRVVDGRFCHPKALGQINEARLALLLDEICDERDVVFSHFRLTRITHALEL